MAAIPLIPLIAAAAISGGAAVYQGEQQRKAAKRSLAAQDRAQKEAQSAAIAQRRENEMALNKANQKQPDLLGLLEAEQAAAKAGAASTMLTGRRRSLGPNTTLLGE